MASELNLLGGRLADFSPCRRYRCTLHREWNNRLPPCVFIMLNPSTADDQQDDHTIRRCIGFAQRWGMGSLVVCNLFALRSTDPRALYQTPDPVGVDNDWHIMAEAWGAARAGGTVVFAWGTHGALMDRGERVATMLSGLPVPPVALAFSKDGFPRHPLYVRGDVTPVPYSGPEQ
jgi:hypothetical protein